MRIEHPICFNESLPFLSCITEADLNHYPSGAPSVHLPLGNHTCDSIILVILRYLLKMQLVFILLRSEDISASRADLDCRGNKLTASELAVAVLLGSIALLQRHNTAALMVIVPQAELAFGFIYSELTDIASCIKNIEIMLRISDATPSSNGLEILG